MEAIQGGVPDRSTIFRQWGRIVVGLIIAAMGVYMQIYANIGLAPWDCLGMGIAKHTPLNYGMAMTVTALIILGIDLLLKERIGFGTIIDALISGNLAQLYSELNPLPEVTSTWAGIGIMLGGFVIQSIGMWLYMSAAQCCGPRDALFVALGKRVPKIPVGIVQIVVWAVILAIGWLLGGPVGIGTLISTFGMGLMLQLVFNIVHFEPRDVKHRSVIEVVRVLAGKKKERLSAVILCGGKSSRMGTDKAELMIGEKTVLQRLTEQLAPVGDLWLSVRTEEDYPDSPLPKAVDRVPDCGPMAGLEAALSACGSEVLFVVPVDMPFIDAAMAEELFSILEKEPETDALLVTDGEDRKQYLLGLYRKRVLPLLTEHLQDGSRDALRIRSFLEEIKVRYVPAEELTDGVNKTRGYNTEEEYRGLNEFTSIER